MTESALVDSLEYYMDELIDSFEDFVKKSLILISVALGSVVIMALYVLKHLADQQPYNRRAIADYSGGGRAGGRRAETTVATTIPTNNMIKDRSTNSESTSRVSSQYDKCRSSRSSYEEKVIREIGFSTCSKPCITSKPNMQNTSSSRTACTSISDCIPKNHIMSLSRLCLNNLGMRTSCCSNCCVGEETR